MNKNLKMGLVLGCICLISAGIVAGTYALTHEKIAQNAIIAENKALYNIYGESADYQQYKEIKDEKYNYLQKYWTVYESKDSENLLGYIFKASGKNAYGDITSLFEVKLNETIGKISLIENTQTYKDTLEENYVDPVNKGTRAISDVTCGATFGATLIHDMSNQALKYYKEVVKNV